MNFKFNRLFWLALVSSVTIISQANKVSAETVVLESPEPSSSLRPQTPSGATTEKDAMLLNFDVPATSKVSSNAVKPPPTAPPPLTIENASLTIEPAHAPSAPETVPTEQQTAPLALETVPVPQTAPLALETVPVPQTAPLALETVPVPQTAPLALETVPSATESAPPVVLPAPLPWEAAKPESKPPVSDPLALQFSLDAPVVSSNSVASNNLPEEIGSTPSIVTSPVALTAPATVVTAPAPVVTAPAPVVTAPAPVVTAPAPVVTAPAPVVTAPAPVVTAPAPVVTAPAPVVTAPAPTRRTDAPTITGVDVSAWQVDVDFAALKDNGVHFAYLKSTEGKTFTDPDYAKNRQNARKAGVVTGAYHFFRPATSAKAQVDHFMNVVGQLQSDDLPPALDLEDKSLWVGYSQKEKIEMVLEWLTAVEARTGVKPIIYASPSFVEDVLGSAPELAPYKLWIAHYTGNSQPSLPKPFTEWLFWQHTDKGRLPGVAGNLDLNRYEGDASTLLAAARSTQTQQPTQNLATEPRPSPMPLAAQLQRTVDNTEQIINFDLPPVS